MSIRDQLFSARPAVEPVEVPGVGTVHVRAFTSGERDLWEAENVRTHNADMRARLVVLGACDESGVPLFTRADVAAISGLPTTVVEPVFDAVVRVNGLRADSVEEARKNSGSGPASGSD